jgi:mRNA interferase MazF
MVSDVLQAEEDLTLLPRRWHLYIVNLEPRIGTKPGKQRPCLAVQPSEFGEAGLASTVVLPLTTKIARQDAFPLRVRIPKGICGLDRDSEVLVDQILAWDNALFHKELGVLPEALVEKVAAALKDFLDI